MTIVGPIQRKRTKRKRNYEKAISGVDLVRIITQQGNYKSTYVQLILIEFTIPSYSIP